MWNETINKNCYIFYSVIFCGDRMFSLDIPSCSHCHSATESAENICFELHAQNLICCRLTHTHTHKRPIARKHSVGKSVHGANYWHQAWAMMTNNNKIMLHHTADEARSSQQKHSRLILFSANIPVVRINFNFLLFCSVWFCVSIFFFGNQMI